MVDVTSILSAAYKSVGSAGVPSRTPYVAVDPKLYQGTWSGTYQDKKSFTLTVSNVNGFRAQVSYHSGSTIKHQTVLIKDSSFRVGDTKFTLAAKAGTAQIKNVVTDPATGGTFLDTAVATLSQ
jgi:hypothetical protein